jgi:sulfotransferase
VLNRFHLGLSRRGSALLASILPLNSWFKAEICGPLVGLFGALVGQMSAHKEYLTLINDGKERRILCYLCDSFYVGCLSEVIFATGLSRSVWMLSMAMLFSGSRVIAFVRDVPWIVDSIERLVRRNVFSPSLIFCYMPVGAK